MAAPSPSPFAAAPRPDQRWSLSFPPSNGALFSSFGDLHTPSTSATGRRDSAPATYAPRPSSRASLRATADEDEQERRAWQSGQRSRSTSVMSHYGESNTEEDSNGWKGLKKGVKGTRRRSLPTLSVSSSSSTSTPLSISNPIPVPLSTPPEPTMKLYFPAPRVPRSARVRRGPLFSSAPALDLELGPRLPTFYEFLQELDPELQPLSAWMPQEVEVLAVPEAGEGQAGEPVAAAPAAVERKRPAPLEIAPLPMPVIIPRLRRNDTIQEEPEDETEPNTSGLSSGSSSPTHTLLFSPHPSPSMSECEGVSGPPPTHSPYWSPTADAIEWSCSESAIKGLKPLKLPSMVTLSIHAKGDDDDFPVLSARAPTLLPPLISAVPASAKKGRKAIVIAKSPSPPPMLPMIEVDVVPTVKLEIKGDEKAGELVAVQGPQQRMSLHEQFWDALEELDGGSAC